MRVQPSFLFNTHIITTQTHSLPYYTIRFYITSVTHHNNHTHQPTPITPFTPIVSTHPHASITINHTHIHPHTLQFPSPIPSIPLVKSNPPVQHNQQPSLFFNRITEPQSPLLFIPNSIPQYTLIPFHSYCKNALLLSFRPMTNSFPRYRH